jgi:hypothetical protein
MLPEFVIEEIRKRGERRRQEPTQPSLELPLPSTPRPEQERKDEDGKDVVIIQVM